MYDSPTDWCPIARAYVELDESQAECAAQQHCAAGECPLARYFFPPEASAPKRRDPAGSP